jgi:hypothetical protein
MKQFTENLPVVRAILNQLCERLIEILESAIGISEPSEHLAFDSQVDPLAEVAGGLMAGSGGNSLFWSSRRDGELNLPS